MNDVGGIDSNRRSNSSLTSEYEKSAYSNYIKSLKKPYSGQIDSINMHGALQNIMTPFHSIPYDEELGFKLIKNKEAVGKLLRKDDSFQYARSVLSPGHRLNQYRNQNEFSIGVGVDGNTKTVGFFVKVLGKNKVICVPPTEIMVIKDKHKQICSLYENVIRQSPLSAYHQARNPNGFWSDISVRTNSQEESFVTVKVNGEADKKSVEEDKSGDSYLYDILNDKEELILGHLSMLTCIAFNEDGSLMITSDRDEKIRISHFPNAYNIQGFCLGHEDFVTNFKLINKDLLISSSGDGSLRLWKYLEGTQVDVAYPFQDAHIEVNDDDQDAAVIYFSVHEVTDSDSYIIVVLERSPSLVCYKVCDGKLCFTSSIKLPSPPITVTVNNSSSVWTLCQDGLHILELNKGAMKFVGDSVFQELLQTSKDDPFFKDLDGNEGKIEQLRKRIIDNTREYMKRKEERLGKEVEPVVKKTKCNA
ncbi:TRM82 [Lepeophtheirus salmonis]|uniref:tRNA (guanine-N(7)-)-methyltransferase non-catalytic subunit n=1 Tax=Lepeophtheirus salmonis TaxID=72036 RepID=A0A7R8CEN7_LEPSM|nr:TRM82 [Lepeophtheirus salmonis]CAF2793011.1 TRM82 [Lepeophtheirus salmonis]